MESLRKNALTAFVPLEDITFMNRNAAAVISDNCEKALKGRKDTENLKNCTPPQSAAVHSLPPASLIASGNAK